MSTDSPVVTKRKLIEVALPLDAINKASAREKSIRHGHPSTLHLWWARRPLAAARAVIFAQMVDDPSANPDLFPTEAAQEKERRRLFGIIEELVKWENTTNETVLEQAREEIWQSWRRTCAENADHPRADELFNRDKLPAFHDPFAGGGSLPLEAQRLGLEAHASDLNPVAVLINKAMIEIPPKFAGKPPVNPESRNEARLTDKTWRGAEGLADDVRYYGQWMRDEAERRIGHLYPKVLVTEEMAADRPDLDPYVGRELTVIAWLWARTVKSPNPAFADVDVPLASTFVLSKKKGREAWVEPVIDGQEYRFEVKAGRPPEAATSGTRNGGANSGFSCLLSGTPMTFDYLRSEAKTTGLRARLMAVVAEGDRGRVFLTPPQNHEQIARIAPPENVPESDLPEKALGFRVQEYAMTKWRDLFTDRQLVALTTFSDLVSDVHDEVRCDAATVGLDDDGALLSEGGVGASAYADAIKIFLAFAASKAADSTSKIAWWQSRGDKVAPTFTRQAMSMVWDYAEVNPLSNSTRNWIGNVQLIAKAVASFPALGNSGTAYQSDAAGTSDFASEGTTPSAPIISTDPPYYDNIGYADLSEFFYVWLRRTLRQTVPGLFARLTIPKDEELIATPFRHASKDEADDFFLTGMSKALARLSTNSFPDYPLSIYYAYKQAEMAQDGISSSGWETFLGATIESGHAITATWPIRTERPGRIRDVGSNALASSIVLVCRTRPNDALTSTRREFQDRLRSEFPDDLSHLQRSNIAPVDLAQASIGPGMRIFTEYREVLNADGSAMTVREALALINATLDEVLAEQEGDFDADSRWALTWFEQHGFDEGEFGDAEQLSKAKNTSPDGLVQAGVIESRRGKVRLYRPSELADDWDAASDSRLTVWEMTHHLIRLLESEGEPAAAELAAALGAQAETARDLAYRLYVVSDRKKRAEDARQYNALVQSWSEIMRLAQLPSTTARQAGLEFAEE
ncbi:MAG: DUF1156 domain-containing protein [Chloroflexi bacterium]|nr:DUF1156 domain-containing protein [Chloroflexota bacterium]